MTIKEAVIELNDLAITQNEPGIASTKQTTEEKEHEIAPKEGTTSLNEPVVTTALSKETSKKHDNASGQLATSMDNPIVKSLTFGIATQESVGAMSLG